MEKEATEEDEMWEMEESGQKGHRLRRFAAPAVAAFVVKHYIPRRPLNW